MKKQKIIHFSFLGLGVVIALVGLIGMLVMRRVDDDSVILNNIFICVLLFGISFALLTSMRFKAMNAQYNGSKNSKLNYLLIGLSVLGWVVAFVLLFFIINYSYFHSFNSIANPKETDFNYSKMSNGLYKSGQYAYLVFSILDTAMLAAFAFSYLLVNLNKLFPKAKKLPIKFFDSYSYYIAFPVISVIGFVFCIYFSYVSLLNFLMFLVLSYLVAALGMGSISFKSRDFFYNLVFWGTIFLSILDLVVGFVCKIYTNDFTDLENTINVATASYALLNYISLVVLAILRDKKIRWTKEYSSIIFLILPFISFVIQIFVLYNWYALLAVPVTIAILVLLGISVFKDTAAPVKKDDKRVDIIKVKSALSSLRPAYYKIKVEEAGTLKTDINVIVISEMPAATKDFVKEVEKQLKASHCYGSNVYIKYINDV